MNISKIKLSDSEIIAISLVGEAIKIDCKKAWFYFVKKNYKELLIDICDRTRFNSNITKRNFYKIILEIQKKFSNLPIFKDDDIRIIDSMLVIVCKFGRAYSSKLSKIWTFTDIVLLKKKLILNEKLRALVTINGFITNSINLFET